MAPWFTRCHGPDRLRRHRGRPAAEKSPAGALPGAQRRHRLPVRNRMKSMASITRRWALADEETLGASGIDATERRRRRSDAMQAWRRLFLACDAALGHKAETTLEGMARR